MPNPDALLLTGASSGVGFSLLPHLSQRYVVIAVARRVERILSAHATNPNVRVRRIDLSNPLEVDTNIECILEEFPSIRYVVNVAGVNVRNSIEAASLEQVQYTLNVNAISPFIIMKKVLPQMKAQNFGRVINVTSGAPLNCFAEYALYSASKGALNAFSVTAAREYASFNIKINLMSPGPVRTEMAPNALMSPEVCHPTVDYLLSLDESGPTGRFFWLGYDIPLFPDLDGIHWLEGRADARFRKVF